MQLSHTEEFSMEEYRPGLHVVHITLLSPSAAFPAGHAMQEVDRSSAEIHPAGQLKGNRLAAEQAEPARQLSHCKLFELADAHPPGQAKHSGIDFFGACHPPGHS